MTFIFLSGVGFNHQPVISSDETDIAWLCTRSTDPPNKKRWYHCEVQGGRPQWLVDVSWSEPSNETRERSHSKVGLSMFIQLSYICHVQISKYPMVHAGWWYHVVPLKTAMLKLHNGRPYGHGHPTLATPRSFHADFASAVEWGSQRLAVR